MKNIRFTQVLKMHVTIEGEVPDDWTEEDINGFAKDCTYVVTIGDPTDVDDNGNEFVCTGYELTDCAVASAQVIPPVPHHTN